LKDELVEISDISEEQLSSQLKSLSVNRGGTKASRVMQEASVLLTLDALSGNPDGSFGLLPLCRKFTPQKVGSFTTIMA